MLLYDNKSKLRVLLELRGSIYKRIWPLAVAVSLYCAVLQILLEKYEDYLPITDHPFGAQSYGTLLAFAVCFRVNIAWQRYWDACREQYLMFCKWGDAYSQLMGFINSSSTSTHQKPDLDLLNHAREEVTHYFSVLSAVAYERISRGDIRRMEMRTEKGVPWKERIVVREDLWGHDLTGARNLVGMRPTRFLTKAHGPSNQRNIWKERPSAPSARSASFPDGVERTLSASEQRMWDQSWEAPATVVGRCSDEEMRALQESKHRVAIVIMWIFELVTALHHHLDVPAPILSRVYQEISSGALGYNQAEKLSDVPFPFPFAQLLAVQVIFFALSSPIVFTTLMGKSWVTPIMSTVVVVSLWALNEIAKELENPHGVDDNDVPLLDAHERFVELLREMCRRPLPPDRVAPKEALSPERWPSGAPASAAVPRGAPPDGPRSSPDREQENSRAGSKEDSADIEDSFGRGGAEDSADIEALMATMVQATGGGPVDPWRSE